jgi:hypothetical protein
MRLKTKKLSRLVLRQSSSLIFGWFPVHTTGHPARGFSWFSSFLPDKARIVF